MINEGNDEIIEKEGVSAAYFKLYEQIIYLIEYNTFVIQIGTQSTIKGMIAWTAILLIILLKNPIIANEVCVILCNV